MFDFRSDDPWTSEQGAKDVAVRKGSQQARLLIEYARQENWTRGLTSEEAGNASGLSANPRCCYWKRCSELAVLGLIEDTGEARLSSAGSPQRVFRISMSGMRHVKDLR